MENYPIPVTKQGTKKILDQMNNLIYKFYLKEGKSILGFFYNIQNENQNIPVVIINDFLTNEKNNNKIQFSLNNQIKTIELGDIRYKNKNFNISIIEIKENNLDENINYLEMDNYLYNQEYEMYYKKDSIYIIQYENLENVSVSYGLIDNIYKTQINFIGNINSNSKISLIFNLANYKLIGIHEKTQIIIIKE